MSGEFVTRVDADVPASMQCVTTLARRRLAFLLLIVATIAALATWLASILAPGGFGLLEALMLVAFLIYAPWHAIGFWNSLIGFVLLHATRDPLGRVIPPVGRARDGDPASVRTAIAMTVRNEDPTRAFAHLKTIMTSLDSTGYGRQFDVFVLSDTTDPDVIAAEEKAIAMWRAEIADARRLNYRRRTMNVGFKGGNVHEFCERFGKNYELMVLLDSDSLMTGEMIVQMVRVMQANPRLGILQSLAVGLPTRSLFARIFQFGHRHGMRCFVVGAGWWQGDCCQFWGHNAAIRVAPFTQHCRLPILAGGPPFGGHIICHDQIEAALMRRAGYEVRLLPQEGGSYEGNPPALPDFVQRNSRWCQGNLQNLRLFDLAGLATLSRFHLAFMAQKFIGAAAVVMFVTLAAIAAASWPAGARFPAASALAFYLTWLVMYFTPKIAGVVDALLRSAHGYGGAALFIGGAIVEVVFTFLLVPVSMIASACFIAALLLGRSVRWNGQRRDGYDVSWRTAFASLWLPTAYGCALVALLACTAPAAIPWFLPFLSGLVLAIPFAIATASRRFGSWAAGAKLCTIPEEVAPPPEIAALLPLIG